MGQNVVSTHTKRVEEALLEKLRKGQLAHDLNDATENIDTAGRVGPTGAGLKLQRDANDDPGELRQRPLRIGGGVIADSAGVREKVTERDQPIGRLNLLHQLAAEFGQVLFHRVIKEQFAVFRQ